ncbi:YccF domain-containing protein [Arthrobacter sp. zg-Y916]|uniref:YccF domain-containing protein n=1 Tax=Arthrobacter caoxuetaonis TaxID=2886935 RepID=A0A9X1MC55_9MICC|nr:MULTISPECIES: YccF domain-containing protein [Arthrobacter]MCC3296302.1 YccF domain-containing protein [Arthrobacter caoxuetaonis]MCC9192378.1 YccF domain-containing protein [Arthrobacter sp. zg-Y916]USQ56851.1 YccF domain-containing protein [Arthrobacter caoxuetaonis]
MKAILNVIWLLFGGIWLALGYVAAGIICCLLIVTIPFGIASFRIASYALWPFGRTVIDSGRGTGVLATLGNVIWLVFAGIWIAIGHVLTAIPMFVSIIGIPLGIANLKMIPISLVPLGKRIVPTSGPGLVPYNSRTPYAAYPGGPGPAPFGR